MSGIAVPLFFMVNGFLLAPKDGGIKYYYRKIFNIVKIVCVFTFIFDIPKLVRGDISILIPFKQACSSLFFKVECSLYSGFWKSNLYICPDAIFKEIYHTNKN